MSTMDIARGIRMARAFAGLKSLDAMAAATGLSRVYLWRLDTGRAADPGLRALEKIASGCGVKLSRIIAWAEEDCQ